MPFDINKYKNIAQQQQQRYLPNSMNHTANRYMLEAEAERLRKKASSLINDRLNQINNPKRTYTDAVNYIRANKDQFQKEGAYKLANEIRNDPLKQQSIKDQGYNVSDYINALYAGLSDGQFRSEREYNQYVKERGKQAKEAPYTVPSTESKSAPKKKDNKSWFDNLINDAGDVISALNPFDNTSSKEAQDSLLNKVQKHPLVSPETQRFANRAVDSATLGGLQALDKLNGGDYGKEYWQRRPLGKGGWTDLLSSGIGFLAPGTAAFKAAKATGLGGKVGATLASRGAPSILSKAAQIGTEGGLAGGIFGTAQQTADELINPEDANLKQRLANVAIDTGLGLVGDPLLHGLGSVASKGLSKLRKGKPVQNEVAATNQAQNIKDILPLQVGTTNTFDLAERLPKAQGEQITNALDNAKKNFVDFQEKLTNDLYNKVVDKEKGLGIKNGSKESGLVQDFGEKTLAKRVLEKEGIDPSTVSEQELNDINLAELKRLAPNKWQDIVKADQYFRNAYDTLIYRINQVRSKIYPGQEDKLVPRRQDYYHHFNDLTGLESARNLFDTPANIDPHLEGVSPFTKPKSKFQGFMQRRGLGPYKSDAVGGYLKYLKAASHSINIDPVIPVLRNTAKDLADATTESRNANKLIEALNDQADDFAGKTNPYDRWAQKIIGRKGMKVATWLNSRVKSNMILGNLSSTLGQLGNVPLGIAKAKQYSVPGLINTLKQSADVLIKGEKNAPIFKSQFLKERYSDQLYRRFDQKLLDQPKKLAAWMLETGDKAGTNFIWNSMYQKGLKQKVKDPIKFADTETRKIVAGRGVGEVPLLQKSKTVQVLAPFTLEVGNQWRVLKNMVGEKDAIGIMTFLVAAWGLNRVTEQLRGSGVSCDPVDALLDGYRKTDGNETQKLLGSLGSLSGEIIGNFPGGNIFTSGILSDKKIPGTNKKFTDLFVDRNPNRFGSGITASKPIENPLYAILPFGASQANKTYQGLQAIKKQGLEKGGKLRTPINTGPLKDAQLLAFGPYSAKESQQYFDQEKRPLSKQQTKIFKDLKQYKLDDEFYKKLSQLRKNDKNPTTLQNRLKEALSMGYSKAYLKNLISNYPNK